VHRGDDQEKSQGKISQSTVVEGHAPEKTPHEVPHTQPPGAGSGHGFAPFEEQPVFGAVEVCQGAEEPVSLPTSFDAEEIRHGFVEPAGKDLGPDPGTAQGLIVISLFSLLFHFKTNLL